MIDAQPAKPKAEPEPPAETDCYQQTELFPLTSFCDRRHMTPETLKAVFGQSAPPRLKPEDVLFLDTETTGLSGGAGTLAFEVGLGYLAGNQFVTEQYLMRDYNEEGYLLRHVADRLRAIPALVTFNGRTFDVPLLRGRLLMNRMRDDCVSDAHFDALYPSRRVWKLRLGRCTLQRLEEAVLGVTREDDLPGAQVPQTYFKYLQNRDFYPIARILDHNRQDVVSLAQLFFYLCQLYDQPETTSEALDLFSLARAYERSGERARSAKCYRLCARGDTRARAFAALAAQEKRAGNVARSLKLYTAMARRQDDPIDALEALSKLYEHQLCDPAQALICARQALWLLSEPSLCEDTAVQERRNALQYRYARLHRKLARTEKTGGSLS